MKRFKTENLMKIENLEFKTNLLSIWIKNQITKKIFQTNSTRL